MPFSTVLQRANQPADESPSGTNASRGQNDCSRSSAGSKRDAKAADSKSNDSPKSGAPEASAVPSLDVRDCAVPLIVVAPQPSLTQPLSVSAEDRSCSAITGQNGKKSDEVALTLTPLSEDPPSATSHGDTSSQDLRSTASAESATADAIKAEAAAEPCKTLANAAASDSKSRPSNGPSKTANGPHETAKGFNGDYPALAPAKSEVEKPMAPPSVTVTGVDSLVTAKLENGNLAGARTKSTGDKSRVGVPQESAGASRKTIDLNAGSSKGQSRKDDTLSSNGSPVQDLQTTYTSAKSPESSASFSGILSQSSLNSADGKNTTPGMNGKEPQLGQPDPKSPVDMYAPTPEGTAGHSTSIFHSAKLVERLGETELRLGIRAGEFGSVDVRTSMVRNQFTAEISSNRGELGRALAAELPSLQNRLTEQRVSVANITVQNHSDGQSSPSDQQKGRSDHRAYAGHSVRGPEASPFATLLSGEASAEGLRLDVRM